MDIQDVYNAQKELVGIKKCRDQFNENEYSMSCFIWIVNDEGKMLIQQRSLKDDNKPGSYGITGGAVDAGETSLIASIRELNEELGIKIDKSELTYIGTERRKRKFFEYYFLNTNISKDEMELNEEVEKVEWISLDDYEKNISNATNFQMLKNYYNNIFLEEKKQKKI